tara:strand:- start:1211 stop:1390 length:180 start_codon:yes stop_codon:yes gene_type:complete
MTTYTYSAIRVSTGEVLLGASSYSLLEREYADTPGVKIVNNVTGVEWDACPDATPITNL